jgi:beta-lactamase regulating signal transducer with metallopeptidase domain
MSWSMCILSNIVLASLLALAAWVVQRWLRRPALARLLWLLVLVKLVTPPLVGVPVSYPPGLASCVFGTCRCGQHVPTQGFVRDTLPWLLLAIWSAGASATGWTAWRRWTGFRRLVADARLAPEEWQLLAAQMAAELSLRRVPEVLVVPGRLPPLVVPVVRRPRILLPAGLLDRLSFSQREALLLHELVHLQRRDHVVRLLELFVGIAYWWLPIVGSIGRRLRACEETCCDAAVVALMPQARRDYARLLLDVVDFADPLPRPAAAHATAMSAAQELEQRLRGILNDRPAARRSWPATAAVLVVACIVLPSGLQHQLTAQPPLPAAPVQTADPATPTMSPDQPVIESISAMCCPS